VVEAGGGRAVYLTGTEHGGVGLTWPHRREAAVIIGQAAFDVSADKELHLGVNRRVGEEDRRHT